MPSGGRRKPPKKKHPWKTGWKVVKAMPRELIDYYDYRNDVSFVERRPA